MLLDILPEIFQNLSVIDLLQCRQVCRAWRYVVDRNFPDELCLYVRGAYAPDVWVLDCKPIDPRSTLTVHSLAVLADANIIKLFGNLKRLMIKCQNKEPEILTSIGQLDKLEHLELHAVSVEKDFELNLDGLKKFYINLGENSSIPLANSLPSSLETFGQYKWSFSDPFEAQDQLKVLITKDFTSDFLRLVNLERLHVTFLSEEADKPRVFLGRLPKLVLLDIFHIDLEEHMNELLEEVASLKPARKVKFYHMGINSSVYVNERRQNPDLFENLSGMMNGGGRIYMKRMLSVAQKNPELVLPFCYFQHTFMFCKRLPEISLSRPFPFELLKNFSVNINKICIDETPSYDELRTLLTNFKHILVFTIRRDEFDEEFERFFDDLSGMLENLVILEFYLGTLVLESLNFLDGFRHLLGFTAMWRENEENRKTIQVIEERKKNMKYPLLAEAFNSGYLCEQKCENFLK